MHSPSPALPTPLALLLVAAVAAALAPAPASGASAAAPVAAAPAALDRPMTLADRRHLLLRSGIGAAPPGLLALAGLTRREGVARVVAGLRTVPTTPMPPFARAPLPHYHAREDMDEEGRLRFDRRRDAELAELRAWWVREMLESDSPQTERLTLFWHDLFATSYHGTDRQSLAMARQNATFRRLGGGSWETLLKAMIRDRALLDFLDADANRAASPNENLARELMELFTLGEGRYTQRDVAEAARAFTGQGTAESAGLPFRLRTWDHDDGEKVLFGEGGVIDGDDVVERVLGQPEAARFLAARFWQAFVADGEPEPRWLDAVSTRFRESGHDIGALYRATLESDAFWAAEHRGAIVRSPLDLLVGTARSLDYPKRRWHLLAREMAGLGMALFAPPDVAGWRDGEAWLGGGALLDRRRTLERHVGLGADGTEAPSTGEGMAAMSDGMDGTGGSASAALALRVAAEHYRGPARWRVSLLADGEPIWHDRARSLADGHDTERDGRLGDPADMPWQRVPIPAPGPALARADAVAVEYLDDAAGSEGDRNLFVDGVEIEGRWLPAADGRQSGDCPPENAADAGRLYCAGTLVVERPSAAPADAPPPWRAASAHVRWASEPGAENGWLRATLALNDVATPHGDFHRVQFTLVAADDLEPELRIESFDCVPDCVARWPDCAWRDARFVAARTLAFPLDGRVESARERCHAASVDADTRALVAALGRSAPALLGRLRESPRGARFAVTLDALAERLRRGGAPGGAATPRATSDGAFVVDGAHAPEASAPEPLEPPAVSVGDLETLAGALADAGLGLADLLLAGFDERTLAPLRPDDDETPRETLARLVAHPAFQLR